MAGTGWGSSCPFSPQIKGPARQVSRPNPISTGGETFPRALPWAGGARVSCPCPCKESVSRVSRAGSTEWGQGLCSAQALPTAEPSPPPPYPLSHGPGAGSGGDV